MSMKSSHRTSIFPEWFGWNVQAIKREFRGGSPFICLSAPTLVVVVVVASAIYGSRPPTNKMENFFKETLFNNYSALLSLSLSPRALANGSTIHLRSIVPRHSLSEKLECKLAREAKIQLRTFFRCQKKNEPTSSRQIQQQQQKQQQKLIFKCIRFHSKWISTIPSQMASNYGSMNVNTTK